MRLVLVAGGTGSGKTTIARLVAERTGALVIGCDRYYREASNPRTHDFDRPDAIDADLLAAHASDLLAGRRVDLPIYDFRTHNRSTETESAEPRDLVLVEGILVLALAELRPLPALRVFVHADPDVRLARRIRRDVRERGRDADDVIRQWLETVRPAHNRWVEPSRSAADLVLDGEGSLEEAAAAIVEAATSEPPRP